MRSAARQILDPVPVCRCAFLCVHIRLRVCVVAELVKGFIGTAVKVRADLDRVSLVIEWPLGRGASRPSRPQGSPGRQRRSALLRNTRWSRTTPGYRRRLNPRVHRRSSILRICAYRSSRTTSAGRKERWPTSPPTASADNADFETRLRTFTGMTATSMATSFRAAHGSLTASPETSSRLDRATSWCCPPGPCTSRVTATRPSFTSWQPATFAHSTRSSNFALPTTLSDRVVAARPASRSRSS